MDYQVKTFDELTTRQLHAIYRARTAVFVVEQICPYQEVDGKDLAAPHIFAEQDGAIAAYCRLIPATDGVHLGRVLVARPYRAQKPGRELVAFALECAAPPAAFPAKTCTRRRKAICRNSTHPSAFVPCPPAISKTASRILI